MHRKITPVHICALHNVIAKEILGLENAGLVRKKAEQKTHKKQL
jgi:hypothetical protein